MEFIGTVLSGSAGAGIMTIVLACLQRYWKKHDEKGDAIQALVSAQKVLMIDRVKHLGEKYIQEKHISLENKENLHDMYAAYKALGGNGRLETVMQEVEKLTVTE